MFLAEGREMHFLSYSKKCFTILSFLRVFTNQEIFFFKSLNSSSLENATCSTEPAKQYRIN